MEKTQIIEAATAAGKTKDVLAPLSVVSVSWLKWVSVFDPLLTTLGLLGAVVWVWVRIWAHIRITNRTLSTPIKEGENA